MEEIWKDIQGFSKYEVSSLCRVRNKKRGNLLTPVSVLGYSVVAITDDEGKERQRKIHRLYMTTFHPTDGMDSLQVNHKDGVKNNNSPDNLEWCTPKENTTHAIRTGLRNQSIPVYIYDICTGEFLGIEKNAVIVGKKYGVEPTGVRRCCYGTVKRVEQLFTSYSSLGETLPPELRRTRESSCTWNGDHNYKKRYRK